MLDRGDADILVEAYRFCEGTRNRWYLVNSSPGDSLPSQPNELLWLARSLGTTPTELREHYRRVTRRARRVVERVFYGQRLTPGSTSLAPPAQLPLRLRLNFRCASGSAHPEAQCLTVVVVEPEVAGAVVGTEVADDPAVVDGDGGGRRGRCRRGRGGRLGRPAA